MATSGMASPERDRPNFGYHLTLPPLPEHEFDTIEMLKTHDQYALSEEAVQRDIVDDLPLGMTRELLSNLERTRAEHVARARNAESAVMILREHLHETGRYGEENRTTVGMASHTSRLDAATVATAPAVR